MGLDDEADKLEAENEAAVGAAVEALLGQVPPTVARLKAEAELVECQQTVRLLQTNAGMQRSLLLIP